MKNKASNFLLALLMSMVANVASAYNAKIGGLYYILNSEAKTAEVTYSTLHGNDYSGDVIIPSSVTYNETTYSVTSIRNETFYRCTGLTSVEIPSSVTSISYAAFYGCTGLTSITIPNSVKYIDDCAFEGCKGLTSIEIPNSVTNIDAGAFEGCKGLTSVTIPSSVTSIGYSAFGGCSGLEQITVASGNTTYDSRDNCNAIIETASNTLVAGCKNTIIPNSVTSIGSYAFYGCTGLSSIIIPEGVTSIGESAFDACTGLTSITIPSSVESIGWGAFWGCSNLASIEIPNSVTTIGEWAFRDCKALSDVYCFATDVPATGRGIFYQVSTSSATLHVQAGSIETYKTSEPWSDFGKIVPLTDEELTGIDQLPMDNGKSATPEGIYDLNGRKLTQEQNGVNIIRQGGGNVKRIVVK